MQPNVFIDGRDAVGEGSVPLAMQWILLDVGTSERRATIRLPIPEAEGQQPETQWCHRRLTELLEKLKERQPVAPAEIALEDGESMAAVIEELERAVSAPERISGSYRGRWVA